MNTYQLTEHLLTLDEAKYPLTANTYQSLRNGIIPKELRLRITQTQGEERCWDFCRKCRLISKIRTQVQNGEQPKHILPLVESGLVSSELLFKLYHHNLKQKAEKLFSKHLISQEILNTVRRSLLTEEILPELNHAILVETAYYLWEHTPNTKTVCAYSCQGRFKYMLKSHLPFRITRSQLMKQVQEKLREEQMSLRPLYQIFQTTDQNCIRAYLQENYQTKIDELQSRTSDCREKVQRIKRDLKKGILEEDTYQMQMERLQQISSQCNAERERLEVQYEEMTASFSSISYFEEMLHLDCSSDIGSAALHRLIERIDIFEDLHIQLTMKYANHRLLLEHYIQEWLNHQPKEN